jgi:hypothetical protein
MFAGAGLGIALAIGLSLGPPEGALPEAPALADPQSEAPAAATAASPHSPRPATFAATAKAPPRALDAPLRQPTAASASVDPPPSPHWAKPAETRQADNRSVSVRLREPDAVRDHFANAGLSGRFLSSAEDPMALLRSVEEYRRLREPFDRIGARTYQPKHLSPAELQALLQPLLTGGSGTAGLARRIEVGRASAIVVSNPGGVGGPIVVVRDSMSVLDRIDRVVALIDVSPPQIQFEGIVARVKLTDSQPATGIDLESLCSKGMVRRAAAPSAGQTAAGSTAAVEGLKLAYLEGTARKLFDALESSGPTFVLATPRLVVPHGSKAEMAVGELAGTPSAAVSAGAGPGTPVLDESFRLRLRPLASGDGLVRLEIESDSPAQSAKPGVVVLRDGAALLIGGLVRQKKAGSQPPSKHDQFALLKKPGSAKETLERFETLVLLTTRVVAATPEGAAGMDGLGPEARGAVADGYFRAAVNAQAAGDHAGASQFVDLSLRFDPSRQAAAALRDWLWSASADSGRTASSPLSDGPAASVAVQPGRIQ